jgi:O-antigen/teichoic acid export membrane protein
VLLLAAFPVAVATTVLAPDLVRLFAGRQEAPMYLNVSDRALAILIWFLPLSYVNGLTQYILIALNRQGAITRAFAAMSAFNLAANLTLLTLFPGSGIYIASVLTVLSEAILYLAYLPLLRREHAAQPLFTLAWRPALAALVMGAAMLAVVQLHWLAALAVAPPVYLAALWISGAFGAEERALARRVLGR